MTTQPHFTDANGSTGDQDQYPADSRTAPTQPTDRDEYTDVPASAPREDLRQAEPEQPRATERDEYTDAPAGAPPAAPREDLGQSEQTPGAVPQSSVPQSSVPQSSTAESLFASNELTGLRSRWNDVQAGFVDDPRKCVQTADGLVSDVVQQLTDGFSHARSQLEEQWARGEDVSTEDLRLALKRYRDFFDRLLAV
jgi:hypothetical protein